MDKNQCNYVGTHLIFKQVPNVIITVILYVALEPDFFDFLFSLILYFTAKLGLLIYNTADNQV